MKKVFSIMLVMVLTFSMLTGCGNKPAGNTEPLETKDNSVETESVEKTEVPTVYFEGFMPWIGSAGKVQSTDEALEKVQNYVIEQCGVKPVPVLLPSGSEQEKLNLLIADPNEQLDIIMMNPTWEGWNNLAANGQIIPLNELLDQYGTDIKNAFSGELEWLWDPMTDDDGNIYALPRALETTSFPVYVRKDWLDKLGLDMPTNVEELEKVLEAFKEADLAGNGQTVPALIASLGEGLNSAISGGFTKYGYGYWLDDTDGKIKPGELQPGYKDCITKVNDWYEKGYVHPDSFTLGWSDYEDLFMADRLGVVIGSYGIVANNIGNLKKINPEAEYAYADGIKGPEGFLETRAKASNSGLMITSKSKNPEACMKLLNWVISDQSNFVTMMYGLEGEGWEWADKEKGHFKVLNTDTYGGELYIWPNNYSLRQIGQVNSETGELTPDWEFMMKDQYRYDTTKDPFDKKIFWDAAAINELAPNVSDVDKMIKENVVKFVTGQRDLAEWDEFVNEDLNKAGLEAYVEAYTTFYNQNK